MYRAVLELLITILVVAMARALLTSVLKGVSEATRKTTGGADPGASARPGSTGPSNATGVLHKDPVCGTYVAESTAFQQRSGAGQFFYCSEACKAAHRSK